jgi:hypothetical protein
MASLRELEAKACELRSISRTLTKKRATLKRQAEGQLDSQGPTQWLRAVAVMVYVLTDSSFSDAMAYLKWKKRPCSEASLREWVAHIAEGDKDAVVRPGEDQPRARRQLAEAKKFLSEKELVSWVQYENTSKSVAPSPSAVLDKFAGRLGPTGRRCNRYKYLRRLCSRWGGRKCTFGVGDQLSDAAFEHKAGDPFTALHRFSGPQFWAPTQSLFWGSLIEIPNTGTQNGGRKTVPKWGTKTRTDPRSGIMPAVSFWAVGRWSAVGREIAIGPCMLEVEQLLGCL